MQLDRHAEWSQIYSMLGTCAISLLADDERVIESDARQICPLIRS